MPCITGGHCSSWRENKPWALYPRWRALCLPARSSSGIPFFLHPVSICHADVPYLCIASLRRESRDSRNRPVGIALVGAICLFRVISPRQPCALRNLREFSKLAWWTDLLFCIWVSYRVVEFRTCLPDLALTLGSPTPCDLLSSNKYYYNLSHHPQLPLKGRGSV